ncbi:hypothetical protein JHK87_033341 [Glycine soja]|nr:hypothetical protein JHK87_033341 [Glycine soja]
MTKVTTGGRRFLLRFSARSEFSLHSSVFSLPFPALSEAVSLLSPFSDEVTIVCAFSGEVLSVIFAFCARFLCILSVMYFEI